MTLHGVNLGGWLVAEKWMTPSLFAGSAALNEQELAAEPGGKERLRRHHQTFIAETDIAWLKKQGIQIVRVPVGHWIFGDDKRYEPAIDRLDWLVATCKKYDMQVLIDMHAACGGQNHAEHSGGNTTLPSTKKWLDDHSAQAATIAVLVRLAEHYKAASNIWGIELLNEPTVDRLGLKLARFYRRAYREVTKVARPGTRMVFSDGYAPLRLTNCLWLMEKRDFPVVMDCHIYQVFGARVKHRTIDWHMNHTKWAGRLLWLLRLQQPVMVGEWSAMLPIKTTPQQNRQYITAQQRAFEGSLVHCYWSYKTEAPGRWNFRHTTHELDDKQ